MQSATIDAYLVEKVVCYSTESDIDFFCHLQGSLKELEDLVAELQVRANDVAAEIPSDRNLFAKPLLAQSAQDGRWYRAQALETAQKDGKSMVCVNFVDYGNTGWVERSKLRVLTQAELLSLPMQSVHCSLAGITALDEQADEEKLREKSEWLIDQFGSELLAAFVDYDVEAGKWSVVLAYTSENKFATVNEAFAERFNRDLKLPAAAVTALRAQNVNYPHGVPPGSREARVAKEAKANDDLLNNNFGVECGNAEAEPEAPEANCVHTGQAMTDTKLDFEKHEFPIILLPENQQTTGYMTTACSPSVFYVQLNDTYDQFQQMNNALQQSMTNEMKRVPAGHLRVGGVYAAPFSQDNAWYRAALCWSGVDGSARVHYIDYGNSEKLSADKLCSLPHAVDANTNASPIDELPAQAVVCCLAGVQPANGAFSWPADVILDFQKQYVNAEVQLSVVARRGHIHFVKLSVNGSDIAQSMLKCGTACPCVDVPDRLVAASRFAVPRYVHAVQPDVDEQHFVLAPLKRERAIVSFIEHDSSDVPRVFLQTNRDATTIRALQTALNVFYFEHRADWPLLRITADQLNEAQPLLAFRSRRNGMFYRARIERKIDLLPAPRFAIRLVDFGDMEVQNCAEAQLFHLCVLSDAPICSYAVLIGPTTRWTRAMHARFSELVHLGQTLLVTPLDAAGSHVAAWRLADGFDISAAIDRLALNENGTGDNAKATNGCEKQGFGDPLSTEETPLLEISATADDAQATGGNCEKQGFDEPLRTSETPVATDDHTEENW